MWHQQDCAPVPLYKLSIKDAPSLPHHPTARPQEALPAQWPRWPLCKVRAAIKPTQSLHQLTSRPTRLRDHTARHGFPHIHRACAHTHLVHAPCTGLGERSQLARHRLRLAEQAFRAAPCDMVYEPERKRLLWREAVALEDDLAHRLRVRCFRLQYRHQRRRDLCAKMDLLRTNENGK